MKTSDELDLVTRYVASRLGSGNPELFIVNGYKDGKGEFIHFHSLLLRDIFSSVVFEVAPDCEALFPHGSVVWIYKEKAGIRVREATQDDERAKEETVTVREKLKNAPDIFIQIAGMTSIGEGQQRIALSAASYKKVN